MLPGYVPRMIYDFITIAVRCISGKLKKADGLEVILQVIEQGSRSKITNDEGHLKIEVKYNLWALQRRKDSV